MIYDRHPEQQSKWNKAFWARGRVLCGEDVINLFIYFLYVENLILSVFHILFSFLHGFLYLYDFIHIIYNS